jgi:integrase
MASICDDGNGTRRVTFYDHNRRRRTIYLGKTNRRQAEAIARRVEELVAALITGTAPAADLSRWIADLGDQLRGKLETAGLLARRASSDLGAFLDGYIAEREPDTKASTRRKWGTIRGQLVGHFGENRQLRSITAGDAESWRLALLRQGLAENTVRRASGIAKQWFRAAVRAKLIEENPFSELVAAVRANPERMHFVSREEAERVLEACPDAEWRLMFALARYGGLRVPSEVLTLRWADIDFARGRFTVRSPKTERHEGKAARLVPIFPELRPYLEDAHELAEAGEVFCIRRYRGDSMNLRTQLQRIIGRAGVKPWPKLWQNLRSTRETELAETFPIQAVVAWIGNSEAVARKHYLQVTEDHFAAAAGIAPEEGSAESSAQAAQKVQKRAEPRTRGSVRNSCCFPNFSGESRTTRDSGSGPERTRTPLRIPGDIAIREAGSAESSALAGDRLLADLIACWHELSPRAHARIAALIREDRSA